MEAAVAKASGEMSSRTCLIEVSRGTHSQPCHKLQSLRTVMIHVLIIHAQVILDKDDCSRELLEFGARLTFQASGAWNQA